MSHNSIVHKRIRTLLGVTFALFGLIVAQLFSVQVVRAGTISERAATELLQTSTLLAPRGVISDINGVELARSVAPSLFRAHGQEGVCAAVHGDSPPPPARAAVRRGGAYGARAARRRGVPWRHYASARREARRGGAEPV